MATFSSSYTENDYYFEYKQEKEKAERLQDKVNLLTAALKECKDAGERDIVLIVDKTFKTLELINQDLEVVNIGD